MVAFFVYDIIFLVLFTLCVVIFLYKRRKNLQKEGIMYLYRTQVGVKFINYVGKKYKKTLKVFSYLAVICGYFLMGLMMYLLWQLAYIYIKNPEIVRAIKIPPLIPLIPYLPSLFKIDFLPPFYFTYWIIAIAVIAVFHEFAHGIIAKYNNVRVKTTGFGFLGPFLAAFVEPDEKQMQKKSKFAQISILSAGTFTNLVLAILFFLMLSGFFVLTYVPAGAMFNTYTPGIISVNEIQKINGIQINNLTNLGLIDIIDENNLTNDLILGNEESQLILTRVIANNKNYFITIDNLKEQLETDSELIIVYEDFPAINAGLMGVIIQVESKEIKTHEDLGNVLSNFHPGEEISVKTRDFETNDILEYNLILGEDPDQEGRAVMGIGVLNQRTRLIAKVADWFNFFKEPATHYEPRFNTNLMVFIYQLIWWLALVNISVALVNMLPMGIFDGGRMFMLTIWGITGSEKVGMFMYKLFTYLILGVFLLLMLGWFIAIF